VLPHYRVGRIWIGLGISKKLVLEDVDKFIEASRRVSITDFDDALQQLFRVFNQSCSKKEEFLQYLQEEYSDSTVALFHKSSEADFVELFIILEDTWLVLHVKLTTLSSAGEQFEAELCFKPNRESMESLGESELVVSHSEKFVQLVISFVVENWDYSGGLD